MRADSPERERRMTREEFANNSDQVRRARFFRRDLFNLKQFLLHGSSTRSQAQPSISRR